SRHTCHVGSHLAAVTHAPAGAPSFWQSVSVLQAPASTVIFASVGGALLSPTCSAAESVAASTAVLASSPASTPMRDLSSPSEQPTAATVPATPHPRARPASRRLPRART